MGIRRPINYSIESFMHERPSTELCPVKHLAGVLLQARRVPLEHLPTKLQEEVRANRQTAMGQWLLEYYKRHHAFE